MYYFGAGNVLCPDSPNALCLMVHSDYCDVGSEVGVGVAAAPTSSAAPALPALFGGRMIPVRASADDRVLVACWGEGSGR